MYISTWTFRLIYVMRHLRSILCIKKSYNLSQTNKLILMNEQFRDHLAEVIRDSLKFFTYSLFFFDPTLVTLQRQLTCIISFF